MNVASEVITTFSIVGPLCIVLWFFFRRWMERIEAKIDLIMEYRIACRSVMVTREEYNKGMERVHERIDEQLAEQHSVASRVARLEGKA